MLQRYPNDLNLSDKNAPFDASTIALEIDAKAIYMIVIDRYGQLFAMGQPVESKILTPALCRAARGFLDWTQTDLADRSGVSRSTIRDYEGSRHDVHRATEAQLRLAFEAGGVRFIQSEDSSICLGGPLGCLPL